MIYYVYLIFSVVGGPLYVGKGKGNRWKDHFKHDRAPNRWLRNVIRKYGDVLPVSIIRDKLSEDEAFEVEKMLIRVIGRADQGKGPLLNMTDGGEGYSGGIPSPETLKKMSEVGKRQVFTPEWCAAISKAKKGKTFKTPEWIENHAKTIRGRPPWNKGLKAKPETIEKIKQKRALQAPIPWSEERKRKRSEDMKGIPPLAAIAGRRGTKDPRGPMPESQKRAISLSQKGISKPHSGVPCSAETRLKISLTKRAAALLSISP